jgi:signal transduction histidine kinase
MNKFLMFEDYLKSECAGAENSYHIGLAVVREIVALHGGTVWVKSCKGATFIVEIPINNTQ